MRTAPAPNMVAIPGMNPGNIVAGGGGDGGGGGKGSGKGGKDGKGKKGDKDGDGAEGGGKDGKGGEGCGDPVCPITGKMFLEVLDFAFWATKELRFIRHYTSRRSDVPGSFGFGWTHPFGWQLEERRRAIFVYDDRGDRQKFARPVDGGPASPHPFGWELARVGDTYRLMRDGGERLTFERHPATKKFLLRYLSDVRGNTTTVEYDERGRFIGLTDSERRPFRATLDDVGRVVRLQVPTEPTQQNWMDLGHYRYDEAGDLVEYIDATGFSWAYRYHNHLMVEHRTGCGLSYLYRYDGDDKTAYCIESWGEYVGRDDPALLVPISEVLKNPDPLAPKPKGINYVKLTYVKDQFYSEVENGLGGVTRYFGDSYGRVVKKVEPSGRVTERAFDPETGDVGDQGDGDEAVTLVAYDANGRPAGFATPEGSGRLVHDESRFVQQVEDLSSGAITTVHRNEYGETTSIKYPDGTFEVTEYDQRGLVITQVKRDGTTIRCVRDAMGNSIQLSGPAGTQERAFDYLGRCVEHTSEIGSKTWFRYDGRSEVIYKRLHDGTELHASHDANRNVTRLQIGQRVTQFDFGGLDWRIRTTESDGGITEYRYDVEGNLVLVRNGAGREHTFRRDTSGRIVEVVDFEGLRETRTLDADDLVVARTTASGGEALTYDAAGRLLGAETQDATIALEYASEGGVALVDNGSVVVESSYDGLGLLLAERQGPIESRITWNGGFPQAIDSDVGVKVERSRVGGVPWTLSAGGVTVYYLFPRAQEKVTLLGDDLVRRDAYDQLGFLAWTTISRRLALAGLGNEELGQRNNADQIYLLEYRYSDHGELLEERRSDGRTVEYVLDPAGRVREKSVFWQGQLREQESIRYDAVGSPLLANVGRDAFGRANRLGGDSYEYDHAGRLARRVTDEGIWTYEWDATDNLRRVVAPTHIVEMLYDGRGRRMEKRVLRDAQLTEHVRYVWEDQILLREADIVRGVTRAYLRNEADWAPFGHVDSTPQGDTACYYLGDRSGLPDLAFDGAGNVVWSAERSVFGDVRVNPGSSVDVRVRFANQQYDEDVGLVYNRMRWYEPKLGQYVMPDRLGLDGGLNFRDYVSNPTAFIDPMGEARQPRPTNHEPYGNYPKGWKQPGKDGGRPDKPTSKTIKDPTYLTEPGHWATEGTPTCPGSIPCPLTELNAAKRSGENSFSKNTTKKIDAAGFKYGCHTCGSKNPKGPMFKQDLSKEEQKELGTHFVPDHIPPAAFHTPRTDPTHTNPDVKAREVRLFPQCQVCSNRQKVAVGSKKAELTEDIKNKKGAAAKTEVREYFDDQAAKNKQSGANDPGKRKKRR